MGQVHGDRIRVLDGDEPPARMRSRVRRPDHRSAGGGPGDQDGGLRPALLRGPRPPGDRRRPCGLAGHRPRDRGEDGRRLCRALLLPAGGYPGRRRTGHRPLLLSGRCPGLCRLRRHGPVRIVFSVPAGRRAGGCSIWPWPTASQIRERGCPQGISCRPDSAPPAGRSSSFRTARAAGARGRQVNFLMLRHGGPQKKCLTAGIALV